MNYVIIGLAVLSLTSFTASLAIERIGPFARVPRRAVKMKKGEGPKSLVGYKRAFLTPEAIPFEGVTRSHAYGVSGSAAKGSPGFHAYYKLEPAVEHPQEGSVYLEVLAYGSVRHHEKGWIASDQLVLQVLIGDCTDCAGAQASQWVLRRTKGEQAYRFLCLTCAQDYSSPRSLRDLETLLAASCEEGIGAPVVGTLKGTELGAAFVPTPDPRSS